MSQSIYTFLMHMYFSAVSQWLPRAAHAPPRVTERACSTLNHYISRVPLRTLCLFLLAALNIPKKKVHLYVTDRCFVIVDAVSSCVSSVRFTVQRETF